jgi:hypothetical protein
VEWGCWCWCRALLDALPKRASAWTLWVSEFPDRQTVRLHTLNTLRHINAPYDSISKLYTITRNQYRLHYTMPRGYTGDETQGAGRGDDANSTEPRQVPSTFCALLPEIALGVQPRLESQRATPPIARPQEKGHFTRILSPSPTPQPPPQSFMDPPPRDIYTTCFFSSAPVDPAYNRSGFAEELELLGARTAKKLGTRMALERKVEYLRWKDIWETGVASLRAKNDRLEEERKAYEEKRKLQTRMGVAWLKAKLLRRK